MTVKELIEQLKKLDENAEVFMCGNFAVEKTHGVSYDDDIYSYGQHYKGVKIT